MCVTFIFHLLDIVSTIINFMKSPHVSFLSFNTGWPVVVAGYGVFSPRCLPTPTLSRGIVSKTINFPAQSLRLSEHQSFVMENSNSLDETGFLIVSKVRENCTDSDTREGIFSQSSQNIEPHCAREDNKVHSADSVADHWKTCLKDGKMIPLMMQTTCAVYSGTSGGAVISLHPQYGENFDC